MRPVIRHHQPDPHHRRRFLAEIVSHAVWLYHVFSCKKSGADSLIACSVGHGLATSVFIRVQGVQHYLWCAVNQDGVVLDILVQAQRDGTAAPSVPASATIEDRNSWPTGKFLGMS
jgi:putative transposase